MCFCLVMLHLNMIYVQQNMKWVWILASLQYNRPTHCRSDPLMVVHNSASCYVLVLSQGEEARKGWCGRGRLGFNGDDYTGWFYTGWFINRAVCHHESQRCIRYAPGRHFAKIADRDGVLENSLRTRGRLEDKNRGLGLDLGLDLEDRWPWPRCLGLYTGHSPVVIVYTVWWVYIL